MLTLTSPVETWAHRLPAGLKLAALALATTVLFLVTSPWILALAGSPCWGFTHRRTRVCGPWSAAPLAALAFRGDCRPLAPLDGRHRGRVGDPFADDHAVALANFVTMTTRLSTC